MASDSSSSVERVGDAHVADDTFEIYDCGMQLVVKRRPTAAILIYDGTHTRCVVLDRAEAKFLGKFLLGEDNV